MGREIEDWEKCMYEPGSEADYFGNDFLFLEDHYPHFDKVKIADCQYDSHSNRVVVYSMSCPAQFFEFHVFRPKEDGRGNFVVTTGSGGWDRYEQLYEDLAQDMVGMQPMEVVQ